MLSTNSSCRWLITIIEQLGDRSFTVVADLRSLHSERFASLTTNPSRNTH